jgi:DNA-binding MarR family transcriptional regulator
MNTKSGGIGSLFDDLAALRQDTGDWQKLSSIRIVEVETEALKRHRRGFIRGPFPLPEFHAAAGLPGKALAVWIYVAHRTRVTSNPEVTLPSSLLEAGGIDRQAKARALHALEQAGLIRVVRATGRTPRISPAAATGCRSWWSS